MNTALDSHPTSAQPLAPGDVLVVKVGGGAEVEPHGVWDDVAALVRSGVRVVVVHGGNAALTRLQERLGAPAKFVQNERGDVSRYTDAEAMRLFAMVYAGERNVEHVCALRSRGVNALGLTGVDGGILVGRRQPTIRIVEEGKKKVLRDDHTGVLTRVNTSLLTLLLRRGYTPVITPPAYADHYEAGGGVAINVDGDTAASRLAEVLRAQALVFLSDVPGLLADVADPSSLIAAVTTEADWERAHASAGGRMRRKVAAARASVESGVGRVAIAAAAGPSPVRAALAGAGTSFHMPRPVLEVRA